MVEMPHVPASENIDALVSAHPRPAAQVASYEVHLVGLQPVLPGEVPPHKLPAIFGELRNPDRLDVSNPKGAVLSQCQVPDHIPPEPIAGGQTGPPLGVQTIQSGRTTHP